MPCLSVNVRGTPCESPEHLVVDGTCPVHRPGNQERQREIASAGGAALRAKLAGAAFEAHELAPILTIEDAKRAHDAVRIAVLCRRITHGEGSAATKAIDGWIKAEAATLTARLVGELRAELDIKTREINALRKQLGGTPRQPRVVQ